MKSTTQKDDYDEEKNEEESSCCEIPLGSLDVKNGSKIRSADDEGTLPTLDDSKSTLQSFTSAHSNRQLVFEYDVPAILLVTQHEYYNESAQYRRRPPLQRKQGHICLLCLCDVRRAVILVNIASFVVSCFGTVAMLVFWLKMKDAAQELQDDDFLMSPYDNVMPVIYNFFILTVFCAVFNCVAIVGAICYNAWLVGMNALFIIVATISTIITSYVTSQRVSSYEYAWYDIVFNVAIGMLLFYPNLILAHEIKTGIMSSKTYKWKEEMSCCCAKKSSRRCDLL